ncbi:MAG TPA: hypothetical protein DCZ83_00570 [Candidatus Yonathbacteria bacterium]|nr:hypothetical protein [Candidatus Yonathbacteria bacterium]
MLRLQNMMWTQFYAEKGFLYAMNCLYSAHTTIQSLPKRPQLFIVKKNESPT